MAENETLLAHLSPLFTHRIEEIATAALGYILKNSAPAREGLDDVVRSGVQGVSPVREVRTQAQRQDRTRPDLSGLDEGKTERVLIEAKFRAGLTPRQPNAYLDRLPADGTSVLLFVVPEERIKRLWVDLRGLAEGAGKKLSEVDGERKCMRVEGTDRHLMVVSWTSLLDRMAVRSRDAGEPEVEADIQQLRGLVVYAEDSAFSPIHERGEDFDPDSRRMRDLERLIENATDRGVKEEWASIKGLNRARQTYGYGRYMKLSNAEVWFGVNRDLWAENGETPLWLHVGIGAEANMERIGSALDSQARGRWVPIHLKPGVEYEEILDDVVSQLKTIGSLAGVVSSS